MIQPRKRPFPEEIASLEEEEFKQEPVQLKSPKRERVDLKLRELKLELSPEEEQRLERWKDNAQKCFEDVASSWRYSEHPPDVPRLQAIQEFLKSPLDASHIAVLMQRNPRVRKRILGLLPHRALPSYDAWNEITSRQVQQIHMDIENMHHRNQVLMSALYQKQDPLYLDELVNSELVWKPENSRIWQPAVAAFIEKTKEKAGKEIPVWQDVLTTPVDVLRTVTAFLPAQDLRALAEQMNAAREKAVARIHELTKKSFNEACDYGVDKSSELQKLCEDAHQPWCWRDLLSNEALYNPDSPFFASLSRAWKERVGEESEEEG